MNAILRAQRGGGGGGGAYWEWGATGNYNQMNYSEACNGHPRNLAALYVFTKNVLWVWPFLSSLH